MGQIRRLWLSRLHEKPGSLGRLAKAQVLLSIGSTKVQLKLFWMVLVLALLGLMTTSIVGSTTITRTERWYTTSHTPWNGNSNITRIPGTVNNWGNDCWETTSTPDGRLAWFNSSSQSYLSVRPVNYNAFCSSHINDWLYTHLDPAGLGYRLTNSSVCMVTYAGGIACSALGAPVSQLGRCNLLSTFDCHMGVSNRACVPTFTKSSVQCRMATLQLDSSNSIISATGTSCSVSSINGSSSEPNGPLSLPGNGTQLAKFCPSADAYGDVSFILAGSNATETAQWLQYLMTGSKSKAEIAVECTLSLNSTMEHRMVTNMSLPTYGNITFNIPQPMVLGSTGERCNAQTGASSASDDDKATMQQILDVNARMTAGSAIAEALQNDDLAEFLSRANPVRLDNWEKEPLRNAWDGSKNRLEDFLGVHVATVMSYYWGYSSETADASSPSYHVAYTVWADRVGSGRWTALLYVLPSTCAITLLLWLQFTQPRAGNRHGHVLSTIRPVERTTTHDRKDARASVIRFLSPERPI